MKSDFRRALAMRVGVILEQDINAGGGFQQAFSVVSLLARRPIEGIEYIFFVLNRRNQQILHDVGIQSVVIRPDWRSLFYRGRARIFRTIFGFSPPVPSFIDRLLFKYGIDLVYFLTPSSYAFGLSSHNYIITVWDQCHRDWVEFPEVYADYEFDKREMYYRQILPKAVAVLVDADLSRQKMHERYGIDLERIFVAPFFPALDKESKSGQADVCKKYSIHRPFIFYPAQFWAHKNHRYILEALYLLKEKNVLLDAVFVGNDYGNKRFLLRQIERLGLASQIHFPGFVERRELDDFYRHALALVMPTYFGATNIPPLEAFQNECPVCYPDLPGLREQVGDAAFLMDLERPETLVSIIELLLSSSGMIQEKIKKGYQRLNDFSEAKYHKTLSHIFERYSQIRKLYN